MQTIVSMQNEKKNTAHQTNWRTKPFHFMHATVEFGLWFSFYVLHNGNIESERPRGRRSQKLCDLCLCVRACKRINHKTQQQNEKKKLNKNWTRCDKNSYNSKLNGLNLLTYATEWYNDTLLKCEQKTEKHTFTAVCKLCLCLCMCQLLWV